MPLLEQLDKDLATSMKEGVVARTAVLRLLKSALKNEQIKLGHELSEAEALKVVQREAKQRKDSITQYSAAGRDDLASSEQHELEVIQGYLPQQMSDEELSQLVETVIQETAASGVSQMGMVIGAVLQRAEGRAEGSAVSAKVRERLASS